MHCPTFTRAFEADGAIAARRLVYTSGLAKAKIADATSDTTIAKRPIGVSAEVAAASGDRADIHLAGIADVTSGAAFTVGATLKADGTGRAVTTSTANDFVAGIALQAAGSAGEIVPMLIMPHRI